MIEVKTPLHYLVYETYDRTMANVARFRNKVDADIFVKEHGHWLNVTEVKESKMFICESNEEFAELSKMRERETALAKLTVRERQLLGVE